MAFIQLSRSGVGAAEFSRFWRRRVFIAGLGYNPKFMYCYIQIRAEEVYMSFLI